MEQWDQPTSDAKGGAPVNIIALFVVTLLLVTMIAVSVYGSVSLPRGARVPIHFGLRAYNNWVPKWLGLIVWPAVGILLSVILVVTGRAGSSTRNILLPVLLAIMVVIQAGALKAGADRSRAGSQ